jgi:3-dehydroquinate synthetase
MTEQTASWRVNFRQTASYQIRKAPDIFHPNNRALSSPGRKFGDRRFVVVDQTVFNTHSDEIRTYFTSNGMDAKIVTIPGGEENKSVDNYLTILYELDNFPIHRRDEPIIAIGGGVVTDLVGFAASSYRRGIPHINVPTTLMGYIDASIGIKTGVNFNFQKNRLGAFSPPLQVFLDRAFLKTLPRRHILNGVCEMIKLGLIKDRGLFNLLEHSGEACIHSKFQDETGEKILDRSIYGMLDEIQPNLFEENLARKVDFGHTFSYGLETIPDGDLLHGEAVLLDIAFSISIAHKRGLLTGAEIERILHLIDQLGLPLDHRGIDARRLWKSLEERTYHRNGLQRVPLPAGIGECIFVNDIAKDEIQAAVNQLEEWTVVKHAEIR